MVLMRFELADGTEVLLEAESGPTFRGGPVTRSGGAIAEAQQSFERALSTVTKTVANAVEEMRDAFPERPDELEIEFGIKASVEANGLILAKASGEASFTVTALWKKPPPPVEPARPADPAEPS